MPTMTEDSIAQGEPCTRHKGPTDNIGQSRLPLTFGLVDVVTSSSQGAISKGQDVHVGKDLVKRLALKMLEVPLFSKIQV
jgi:hypothetical protein